jgi:hypothetical protein
MFTPTQLENIFKESLADVIESRQLTISVRPSNEPWALDGNLDILFKWQRGDKVFGTKASRVDPDIDRGNIEYLVNKVRGRMHLRKNFVMMHLPANAA